MKGKISIPRVKICHSVYEGAVRVLALEAVGSICCCVTWSLLLLQSFFSFQDDTMSHENYVIALP